LRISPSFSLHDALPIFIGNWTETAGRNAASVSAPRIRMFRFCGLEQGLLFTAGINLVTRLPCVLGHAIDIRFGIVITHVNTTPLDRKSTRLNSSHVSIS